MRRNSGSSAPSPYTGPSQAQQMHYVQPGIPIPQHQVAAMHQQQHQQQQMQYAMAQAQNDSQVGHRLQVAGFKQKLISGVNIGAETTRE